MDVKIENMIYKFTFNQEIDLVCFTEHVKGPRIEYNPKNFPGIIYRVGDPRVTLMIFDSGKVMCVGAKIRDDVDRALCKLLDRFEEAGIELRKYLFSLNIEYKQYVKVGEVDEQLIDMFKHNKLSLSSSAMISKINEKTWEITEMISTTGFYIIKESDKQLNIYIKNYPEIEIQNIVASGKFDFRINLDLLAVECENAEYEPEQFPALILRLDEPAVSVSIFSTGRINITGAKDEKSVMRAAEIIERIIRDAGVRIPVIQAND